MSNPAVTFGCPLLPSTVADPPSILGVRARRRFADPKGTAYGGSAFSSHLRRIPLLSTGVKIVSAVALFHGFGVARQGPWNTWVNKLSPRYKYKSRKSSSFVGCTHPN